MQDRHLVKLGNLCIKGWESVIDFLMPKNSRFFQVAPEEDVAVVEHDSHELYRLATKYAYFTSENPIIGKVTSDLEDLEAAQDMLSHIPQAYPNEQLREWASAEMLAKVFAYRETDAPFSVSIFGKTYRLDKLFDLWHHIHAYGFVTDDGPPLLLFRGTQFSPLLESGRASIIADLDAEGPGRKLYAHSKKEVLSWLENKRPARVLGYSLGAAMASYALIEDSAYFSKDEKSYLFHLPGLPEELYEKWQKLPESKRPAFTGFISYGDIVSKIGKLFGEIYQMRLDKNLAPISAHTTLFFGQTRCYIRPVDVERENGSFYRKHYTVIHKNTSDLCYKLGLKHFLPQRT